MKSYTLLELIVTVFISSVIILIFSMLLDFSYKSYDYIENSTSYENLGFVLSYLTNEINSSDKVYTSNSFIIHPKYYSENSFVLRKDSDKGFKYIYFYLKRNKLYKLTLNTDIGDIKNPKVNFKNLNRLGLNIVADDIEEFEAIYNESSKLITINVKQIDGSDCSTKVFAYGGF